MEKIKNKEKQMNVVVMDRGEALETYRTLIEDWRCAEEISERFKMLLEKYCGVPKQEVESMHTIALQCYSEALYFDHHRPIDRYRLFVYVNMLVNQLQWWYERNEALSEQKEKTNASGMNSFFKNQIAFLMNQIALTEEKTEVAGNVRSRVSNDRVKLINQKSTPDVPYVKQIQNVMKATGRDKELALRRLFHDYLTTFKNHGYILRGTEHEAVILDCVVDNLR